LITGGRGGIGLALAKKLSNRGLRIAATGRDPATLNSADFPPDTVRIVCDVTTPEGAAQAVSQCIAETGRPPGLLAHCVGNSLIAPLHRTGAAQAREVLRVNLDSALFMLSSWIGALREANAPGAAVFVSSVVARIGVANHEAIAAAKGGIEALVRSAAATYAQYALRVNAVAPGMTETPMTAGMLKMPAMREGAGKQYPLGGVQTAEQVADTIGWLLSDEASRITGQVIAVDGGFSQIRPLVR